MSKHNVHYPRKTPEFHILDIVHLRRLKFKFSSTVWGTLLLTKTSLNHFGENIETKTLIDDLVSNKTAFFSLLCQLKWYL